MNEHCKCEGPGYCERHQLHKGVREFQLCRGEAQSPDCGRKYWVAWESGKLGATAPQEPVLAPEGFCNRAEEFVSRGAGDRLSQLIKSATLGMVSECNGCGGRAATLNHWLPAKNLPPVELVEFVEPVRRNFMFHVWPVKDTGAWQWNCDQFLKRQDLFKGRRVVAIVTSDEADPPEAVKEYLDDFTDEFIVLPNIVKLREVVTFVPLLERMESTDPNEVTFCCHSKVVRHKITEDQSGTTLFNWTRMMYETCLDDWPKVKQVLSEKAMAGSFKRYGQFTTRGNNRWHYSGTFYWFRNRDVYRRNWRYVDQKFFGSESWPGHMFKREETGCLFFDDVKDLYDKTYWNETIQPALNAYREESIRNK